MSNVHVESKIKLQGFDDLFGGKDENEKDAVVEVPLNKLNHSITILLKYVMMQTCSLW